MVMLNSVMELQIIFIFCAVLLTSASPTEEKIYRKDYVYNWRTDAFYKLHVDSGSSPSRSEVCKLEGATLVKAMSEQELSRIRASTNLQLTDEEDGVAADQQPLITYSESQDVLEMQCQVTTRDGYVRTSSIFRNKAVFVCKVEAKDISYNSQCRVYAKGYQYIPSVCGCYKVPRVAYTWSEAAAECQAEGAHLAVINSETEALVLKNITSSVNIPASAQQEYFHIGFRAAEFDAKKFKTIFNENLQDAGFSVWAAGEPNHPYELCGSFYRKEGKLNNIRCHVRYGFVCEKEIICLNH